MTHAEILLHDYDAEVPGTRKTLERIPMDLTQFKPHDKSTLMGKLAMHLATLPAFGTGILSADTMDLTTAKFPSQEFTSTGQLASAFDDHSGELRAKLASMSNEDLERPWAMLWGEKTLAAGPRLFLFRSLFLHHLIHHRAQLGVYLRLNDLPVPGLYGPSADDKMGF